MTGSRDDGLETCAVERAVWPLEHRLGRDAVCDLGVRQSEPHLARVLIERGLSKQTPQQLPVEAEHAGLILRDRPADLARELLEVVVVELAELLDPDLGAADLGDRRTPEAAEDVADTPNREGKRNGAQDHRRDGAADPG